VVRAAEILSALSRRAELPLGMWRADRLTGILLGAEAAAAPDAPDSDWHCPSPGRAHRPAHMNPLSPPHRSSLRRSPAHLEASCLDLLAAWLQQLTGYMRKNRGALLTAELEVCQKPSQVAQIVPWKVFEFTLHRGRIRPRCQGKSKTFQRTI
jgi:hypothetical protein